jgi:hypothetical protein
MDDLTVPSEKPQLMAEAENKIKVLEDYFEKGLLTKDEKIGYRTSQLLSIAQANVRVFVLASTNLSGDAIALTFVKTLPKMTKFALNNHPPFIAKVYRSGRVISWRNNTEILLRI